jgi:Predicted hydrolases or acyltransferases (alpha/beta hydrolase superfamily)
MSIVTGRPFQQIINGQNLNIQIDGPAGAPWMVFSNSLASSFWQWAFLVNAFAGRFRFLRYDQRGHGGSAAPSGPFHMDDLASDFLGLLDAFEVDKAVFVGVSMGATTVLRAAARTSAPSGRCLGVVACDGVWRSAAGAASVWDERFAIVRGMGVRGLAHSTIGRWFRPEFIASRPETVTRITEMIAGTSPKGYIRCGTALQDFDFSADYPAFTVPVLYVAGAQDGDTPAIMKEMADATPNARYRVIDHCGHQPGLEQPEELFAAMDSFVRELGIG